MLVRDVPEYRPFVLLKGPSSGMFIKNGSGKVLDLVGFVHLGAFHDNSGMFIGENYEHVSPDTPVQLVDGFNIHH